MKSCNRKTWIIVAGLFVFLAGLFVLLKPLSNIIAGRPKAALLFWFFMVVLLSICLWYVRIVATCIAVHFAVCHAVYNNKNKKIGKNRC